MKNIIIIILLLFYSMHFTLAQVQDKCLLSGTIEWTETGTVEVLTMVWKNTGFVQKKIHTTSLEKHFFSIEVAVKEPILMFLSVLNEDEKKHITFPFYAEKGNIKLVAKEINGEDLFIYEGSERQILFSQIIKKAISLEDSIFQNIEKNDTLSLQKNIQQYNEILQDVEAREGKQDLYYSLCYGLTNAVPYVKAKEMYDKWYADNDVNLNKNNWCKMLLKRIETNRGKKLNFKNLDEKFLYFYENIRKSIFIDDKGNKIALDSIIRDKFVIIDFWASWCAPCKGEIKELKKIYQKYKNNNNFLIISISIDKDKDKWKKSIEKEKLEWLQLVDENNLLSILDIKHIPYSCVVGSNSFLGSGNELNSYVYELIKYHLN